ncbi:MAG TPA: GTP-binding protein, partial [Mariprofundaceae bacterium]|nr:GTP-binding protein [Mariprofundaceae bacterium]
MCTTCGCGHGESKIEGHAHDHEHHHSHEHGHGVLAAHASDQGKSRILRIEQDILSKNNEYAATNRRQFAARGMLTLNLVSSPGSGKTTLLTNTLSQLKDELPMAVIEGDQQTVLDAERIRATGIKAIQIN